MTRTIAESIYNFLDLNDKLLVNQKECKKKGGGAKDQLSIHKTILHRFRKRYTNLGMISNCLEIAVKKSLEIVQVSGNILEFVKSSITNW